MDPIFIPYNFNNLIKGRGLKVFLHEPLRQVKQQHSKK